MNTPRVIAALLAVALLLLAAGPARAVWPWGDEKEDLARKLASRANTELRGADDVWRAGDLTKAAELYRAAAESYRQAEETYPGLENGLIRFRLSYCLNQAEQIHASLTEKATPRRVTVTHPPSPAARRPPGIESAPSPATTVTRPPTIAEPAIDVRAELAAAQQRLLSNHPEESVAPLIKVLRAEPGNRPAMLMLATVRVQQGRFQDAVAAVEDLRTDGVEDEATLMLAAGAYLGAGRHFDALLALDKVLAANPKMPQAHINMACLLLEMSPDKRAEAAMYYKQALKLGVPADPALEKRLGK